MEVSDWNILIIYIIKNNIVIIITLPAFLYFHADKDMGTNWNPHGEERAAVLSANESIDVILYYSPITSVWNV